MPLTPSDRLFVEQRRARKNFGLYILPLALVVLIAAWAGLFVGWPMAFNPKAVLGAQETGELNCGSGSLSTYATGATVLSNVLFALLGAILVLRIVWSASERRYLKVIAKLEADQLLAAQTPGSVPVGGTSPGVGPSNVRQ